mmetsp:Transcript_32620/g.54995  ORF Transcript_32620/g.54995 Transcript_32620/m.54995 type:complete len:126 (+) Transcript_32620:211-588(+)
MLIRFGWPRNATKNQKKADNIRGKNRKSYRKACPQCRGTGLFMQQSCDLCEGQGFIDFEEAMIDSAYGLPDPSSGSYAQRRRREMLIMEDGTGRKNDNDDDDEVTGFNSATGSRSKGDDWEDDEK